MYVSNNAMCLHEIMRDLDVETVLPGVSTYSRNSCRTNLTFDETLYIRDFVHSCTGCFLAK